jgi:putative ABC transport system ATP-binding protein
MLLGIKELTKEYTRGREKFFAVDHVNLSLGTGDFVSIIGRSGSGKSTLLNLISGLIKPTSGGVFVNDKNIFELNDNDISLLRNEKLGYVPQGQSLLASLTVLDNVILPYTLFKRNGVNASSKAKSNIGYWDKAQHDKAVNSSSKAETPTERALSLLEQVGILHLAESYPKHLSGGEMRRVAIARALINNPDILVADEPTGDLDAQTTEEIMQLLKTISENGTAVLIVTHELDTTSYGNQTYSMNVGKLTQKN